MKEVHIYTTKVCGYCFRAKRLLEKRGIPYQEVDVTFDHAMRDELRRTTGMRTVPQIFIGGVPIGGSDELYELDRSGALGPMVEDRPTAVETID